MGFARQMTTTRSTRGWFFMVYLLGQQRKGGKTYESFFSKINNVFLQLFLGGVRPLKLQTVPYFFVQFIRDSGSILNNL